MFRVSVCRGNDEMGLRVGSLHVNSSSFCFNLQVNYKEPPKVQISTNSIINLIMSFNYSELLLAHGTLCVEQSSFRACGFSKEPQALSLSLFIECTCESVTCISICGDPETDISVPSVCPHYAMFFFPLFFYFYFFIMFN